MSVPETPYTRGEMYLSAIADGDSSGIPERPYTRKEMYLDAIARGDSSGIPERPYTREEMYLDAIAKNGGGGGGDITVESKSISANGTYTAPTGKAYSPVTVDVPNSYAAGDEGKVVSNGELVAQTAHAEVTQNGTVDTTLNNSVTVNVSGGGGWTSDGIATATEPSGNIVLGSSVTAIEAYAFAGKPITRISGADVTSIAKGAFMGCPVTQITKDDFPNVTTITGDSGDACFRGCTKLQLIHFPKLTTIPTGQWPSGTGAIGGSGIKPTMVFPKITTFPNFRSYTTYAAAIDLGPDITTTQLSGSSYFYEGHVDVLIIRKSDAVIATDANSIRRLSSSTKVYVPSALKSSYETASNWSAKGSIFYAIEGSQYENYYADGTPIT